MIKSPAMRRCTECKESFEPKRSGLTITKQCSPACARDNADKLANKPQKKKPKPKLNTLGKLKKELWDIFSLHQKLVHSEDGEWCNCYTCEKPIKIGTSDNNGGHCLSKAANPAIYFDERAVRPQCILCNIFHGGMHYEFNEKLKQEIGLDSWQDMYDNRKAPQLRSRQWYAEQISYYSDQNIKIKLAKS